MVLAIHDAERVLRQMLGSAGLDPEAPGHVGDVWPVFLAFAALPSQATGPDADGILYQSGIYSFFGPEEYHLDFVRQLEVRDDEGEYDHYEQLHCLFRFPVTDLMRSFRRFDTWWFHSSAVPLSEFAALIESRPEVIALRTVTPASFSIAQEIV